MRNFFRGKRGKQGQRAVQQAAALPDFAEEPQPQSPEDLRFVTLFSCQDVSIACVARTKLEYAGIPCYLANEHLIGVKWFYSNLLGGVEVQVPKIYLPMAIALFAEDYVPEGDSLAENDGGEEEGVAPPVAAGVVQAEADDPLAPRYEDFLPDVVCQDCGSADCKNYNVRRFAAMFSIFLSFPLLFNFKRRYRCCACGHTWKQ